MSVKNAFYAQSGGVTAVINATACGVIETIRKHPASIGNVYAGHNGIIGALNEELIDTGALTAADLTMLRHTPGGAFGSCRYKLHNMDENPREYQRLIEVFQAHNVGYFFYNGGGDSQDTAYKVSHMAERMQYPLQCIGIPKTIDNDLPFTDCCPGFGSVAKYVAVSIQEAALDIRSMCHSSTKVFILEVMGRHTGWIAAAAGLGTQQEGDAPHIILFPEVAFNRDTFLEKVQHSVEQYGYCVIAASEGAQYEDGRFVADAGAVDAFGHTQLGGVAPALAQMIKHGLGYKYHWAVADYLQRSARHIASATDLEQAYAVGRAAVEMAIAGQTGVMPVIVRESDQPYQWRIDSADLSQIANQEKKMPVHFIADNGYHITEECRRYLAPLIQGEAYPPYENGLPAYIHCRLPQLDKKLNTPFEPQ